MLKLLSERLLQLKHFIQKVFFQMLGHGHIDFELFVKHELRMCEEFVLFLNLHVGNLTILFLVVLHLLAIPLSALLDFGLHFLQLFLEFFPFHKDIVELLLNLLVASFALLLSFPTDSSDLISDEGDVHLQFLNSRVDFILFYLLFQLHLQGRFRLRGLPLEQGLVVLSQHDFIVLDLSLIAHQFCDILSSFLLIQSRNEPLVEQRQLQIQFFGHAVRYFLADFLHLV